jgi:predicted Zn finger-like uncharacterized protein
MAISVTCPSCSKSYQVKDDAAGKKFRCKACETVVTVPAESAAPAAAEGDPWENLDLPAQEDPYASDNPYAFDAAPAAAPARRGKKRSAKAARGAGMPVTVIVALVCESILLLLSLIGLVGSAIVLDICGGFFQFIRVGLEAGAIYGYVQAVNVIRWISVVMCGLVLLLQLACAGILGVGGVAMLQQANVPQDQLAMMQGGIGVVIAVIVAGMVLYATILGCLLSPSARDYFER